MLIWLKVEVEDAVIIHQGLLSCTAQWQEGEEEGEEGHSVPAHSSAIASQPGET